MAAIDPEFGRKLKKFGGIDFNACYNCGNCTAVCSLSTEQDSFPREMVRFSVLGLKPEIKSSLKPWLCYYCGECSTYCPQEANPGELMMSLRRWLSAQYDWTGLSGLLSRSLPLTILAFLLTAAGVIFFSLYKNPAFESVMHTGHQFEMVAIAAVFAVILLPNLLRMWWFTVYKPGIRVPLKSYISSLPDLFVHMFTQKNTLKCEEERLRWVEHLVLVFAYLGLLFTTVFLDWFSSRNIFVIVAGYVASALIFVITAHFILSRVKKEKEINKFSRPSDWLFVIWLSAMALSALAVRIFIDAGILASHQWLYILHLVILVQWALIIVPFGKWTHFLYRSFAMYFERLKYSSI